MDKEEITFLPKVIEAQNELLTCYRLGGNPPEWAFHVLAKFRRLYQDASQQGQSSRPDKTGG